MLTLSPSIFDRQVGTGDTPSGNVYSRPAQLLCGAAMKVNVTIDCTPEEARAFFGLPDLQPMQKTIMNHVQEKIMANIQAMDPESIMKNWLPASVQGMEQLQQAFWQSLAGLAGGGKK
jgi:hypothetical protein